jgi:hypothetical protein
MPDTLTQNDLDNLTDPADLQAAVGWDNQAEVAAVGGGKLAPEYRAVHVDDIAELRTDSKRKFRGKVYLTRENALTILPPTFGPRDVEGVEYPALNTVPTRTFRAWTADRVEGMRQRLMEHRERLERERLERAAARKAIRERIDSGDPNFRLAYEELESDGRHGKAWVRKSI